MSAFKRVKAANGQVQYIPKFTRSQHRKMDAVASNDAAAIKKLKSQLELLVDGAHGQMSQALNKDYVPQKGKAGEAFRKDAKNVFGEIPKLVKALSDYGVKAKVSTATGKVTYMEGEYSMYDLKKIKEMKLEVYEEKAAGTISENAAAYLINYFDMKGAEAYLEESGCSADDVDGLIRDYIAACSDEDTETKADLEDKLKAMITSKQCKAKVDSLKEKLDDREREFVDELEEKINNGENTDGPATEGADADKILDTDASTEGSTKTGKKPASDDLKKIDDAMADAAGASLESGLSETARMALMNYVTESVAAGDMEPDRAEYLVSAIIE